MTDEQFEKLLEIEMAKVAALDSINSVLSAIAMKQGATPGMHHWDRVAGLIKGARGWIAKDKAMKP